MPRQLIYTSTAVRHLEQHELQAILSGARFHNQRIGVTGMLVYADGSFLQVIEGDFLAVEDVMERVIIDRRHTNILALADRQIQDREFADWDMAFRATTDSELSIVAGFADFFSSRHTVRDRATAAHRVLLAFRTTTTGRSSDWPGRPRSLLAGFGSSSEDVAGHLRHARE